MWRGLVRCSAEQRSDPKTTPCHSTDFDADAADDEDDDDESLSNMLLD